MATLLTTVNAGGSYDYIDIYYTATASGSYHAVQVYANYRKTAGSVSISAKSDCYIKVNGTTACTGQGATYGSGTFNNILGPNTVNVSHGAATTIPIAYRVYLLNASYSGVYKEGSVNITLGALTSACGAPTACTVSPSVVKPGGTVTVSWSGASGGTNNSISSYYVLLNGSGKTINTTAASGSTTFTNLTSRGTSYTAQVRTQGSAGSSYYSGYKTSTNSVKVNSLPKNPTISGSDTTIGVSQAAPSFTVTSQGDPDSQTVTLYYAWSSSGSGTSISSGSSITIDPLAGESKTLYLWATDTLGESSSKVTRTVSRNSSSSISAWNITATQDNNFYQGSYKVLSNFLINSITCSLTYTSFKLKVRYSSNKDFSSSTTMVLNNKNIDIEILGIPSGNYYQFGIIVYNGNSEIDSIWITDNTYVMYKYNEEIMELQYDSVSLEPKMEEFVLETKEYTDGSYLASKFGIGCFRIASNNQPGLYGYVECGAELDTRYTKLISLAPMQGIQVGFSPILIDTRGYMHYNYPDTWFTF